MSAWRDIAVRPGATILDVIRVIDQGARQIALVVDDDGRLVGAVSDGDVRRGILKGVALDGRVEDVMNRTPIVARVDESREAVYALMAMKRIRQVPIVDATHRVVRLDCLDEPVDARPRENWVVLMAGGDGTRLRPLTDSAPKPLLRVGDKPLLETILERFVLHGFRRFYISVRYKAEMVKAHFGSGDRWGIELQYLHEEDKLGTAGALGLIRHRPAEPLVVMNGDVLTTVSFNALMDQHEQQRAVATACVREHEFTIPYGVAKLDGHVLLEIVEKPAQRLFVNAGIYVLNPEVLDLIVPNTPIDMPTLLHQLISRGDRVSAFPIREYWMDIGRADDLAKANGEYANSFTAERGPGVSVLKQELA